MYHVVLRFQSQQLGLAGQWKSVVKSYIDANVLVRYCSKASFGLATDPYLRYSVEILSRSPPLPRSSETLPNSSWPTSLPVKTFSTKPKLSTSPTRSSNSSRVISDNPSVDSQSLFDPRSFETSPESMDDLERVCCLTTSPRFELVSSASDCDFSKC